MKTINKSAKSIVSLILAVAMLAGSLFVANVGININASAETVTNTDTWDGGMVEPTDKNGDDIIDITTAEELAWIALSGGDSTSGKSYKVADGIKAFYINTGYDNSSLDSLKTSLSSAQNWGSSDQATSSFQGTFDGNGVTVYGMFCSGNSTAGLFPWVKGTVSFKNIAVTDSYISGKNCVGAIVGADGVGYNRNTDNVTFENCSVTNNYLEETYALTAANVGWGNIGGLAGSIYAVNSSLTINKCIILNNAISNASSAYFDFNAFVGGFTRGGISNGSGGYIWPTTTYSNCISDARVWSCANDTYVDKAANYQNIYTTVDFSSFVISSSITDNNIKLVTADALKGTNITSNMPTLDWSGTWFANDSYPVLRVFHNLTATNNGNGTHSEECSDCGLVGVPTNHFYNEVDTVNNITLCSCGAAIDGIFDVWDSQGAIDSDFEGKGTEDEPYIIKTVEELYGMVRSTGMDADGNALYYKVADGVSALYINDTRGYASQTAFEEAAAAGTLKNWSTGLTSDTDKCGCGTTHKNACADYFGGKFDGNGVTIYGLYSYTTFTAYWAPGTGFVPAVTGDAVIKNVVFDTNYVKNTGGFIGVITASTGAYAAQYGSAICTIVDMLTLPGDANLTVMNTVVRNTYLGTTASALDNNTYSYVGGFVSACLEPNSMNFINCLYDGTNSTVVTTATDLTRNAGIYSTRQGYNASFAIESCLVVNSASTTMDVVYSQRWSQVTVDLARNSYAYGSTGANTTLGTLQATGYTTVNDLPMLNWTAWDNSEETIAQYGTPMPKSVDGWEAKGYRYYKDAYKNSDLYSYENNLLPYGSSTAFGNMGHEEGAFSDYNELVGAGTESDPYIIDNAQMLFEIIASGGMQLGVPQHFKLACDIDLGGIQWVCDQTEKDTSPKVYYIYNAFGGIIDGDGHTVTGMFTATSDASAGFIPELASTGVVKNLHFRDCYAYTSGGNYGIIAGTAVSGSQIIGCSIENSENAVFAGSNNATITNSYITVGDSTTYYLDSGLTGTPSVDGVTWYQGGADGSTPKLVNRADAMPYADADGDGEGYEYGSRDLAALKSKLLRASDYANIYGDVSRNGKTDIRDMVILQREIIAMSASDPTAEWKILDGFWKNVKAGKFSIYYDENDNYDAARKLELYLEEAAGVDVAKTMGTTSDNLTVRIVTDTELDENNYSVTYDLEKAVLTISGGSFTAVEQAVLNFIAPYNAETKIGSDAVTGVVYTGTGTIDPDKVPVTVYTYSTSNENGSTDNLGDVENNGKYYYVWGDEFAEPVDGTISYDKWQIRDKGGDATVGNTTSGQYANLKLANNEGLKLLNAVNDGKLTMRRGVGSLSPANAGYASEPSYTANSSTGERIAFDSGDMASSGIITSKDSLLFKHGYLEMQATLPNDEYAFPAWWLLSTAGNNNLDISRSLYSKVYPENKYYSDSRPIYFSSADATSYEYQLPTYTYEIDIFEIINNGNTVKNKLYYNLHKWYSYSKSTQSLTESFSVYDLNWNEINADNSKFSTKLLSTTYSGGEHSVDSAAIKYHEENIKKGQVNVAINEFGVINDVNKYGKADGEATFLDKILGRDPVTYDINMITNISGTSVTYKFGFLWTENEMTYILKDTSGNLVSSVTVDLADLGYDGNTNILPDQYVYFLIDNHFYTNGSTVTTAGDMTIEYVRLYQLDDHRDIVTPETERDDVQSR